MFFMIWLRLLSSVAFRISGFSLCFMDYCDKGLPSHYSLLCSTCAFCCCACVCRESLHSSSCPQLWCPWRKVLLLLLLLLTFRCWLSGFLLRRFGSINFPNWILSVCVPTLNHQQFRTVSVDVSCWIWSQNHCACLDKERISDCIPQPRW